MTDISTLLFVLFAIGVAVFFAATAFGFGAASPDDEVLERATELLTTEEARLIDVRTPREFSNNGLEGADNIPLQELSSRLDEVGPKDEPVVLYCRSGNRSAQALDLLEQNGFEQVYDLGAHRSAKRVVDEAR